VVLLSWSLVVLGGCSGSSGEIGTDARVDTAQNQSDVLSPADVVELPTTDAGTDVRVDAATDGQIDTSEAGADAAPDAGDDRPPVTACTPGLTGFREAVATTYEPVSLAMADFDLDGQLDAAIATGRIIDTQLPQRSLLNIVYGAGGGVFGRRVEIPMSQIQTAVVTADFNSDGAPDLAVASTGARGVEVLFNAGGSFGAPLKLPTSGDMFPKALIARDLDADGLIDLAWTGESSTGALAIAKGGGETFATPQRYLTGSRGTGLAAGDLNEDGIPDLVVSDDLGGAVRTLLGQGGFQFGPATSLSVATPLGVDIADFNEDRHLDVVVLTGAGPRILRGRGDGSYAAASGVIGATGTSMLVTDFDRDGHTDVAVLSGSTANTVGVSRGRGDGTFLPVLVVQAGQTAFGASAADLTGDTRLDLVVANIWNSMLTVLPATTSGFVQPMHWKGRASFSDFAVVDLDKDGDLDVVTGKGDLLAGASGGELTGPTGAGFTAEGDGHFVVVDWTGDGLLDVVADAGGENVRVYAATAGGAFADPVMLATPGASRLRSSGDFDGDGRPDLVLIDTNLNGFVIVYGDGHGGIGGATPLPSGEPTHSPGWGIPEPTVVDIDKDGFSDVLIRYVHGLTVARGAQNRTFSALARIEASFPKLAVADVDGDGRLDLILSEYAAAPWGGLLFLRGRGDGSFDEVTRLPLDAWLDIAVADVDGDRNADLVVSFGRRLELWNLNGLGAPTPRTVYPYGGDLMRIADLDSDGTADIILARPGTGEILRMHADCR
jgi:hypothetical protein